MTTEIGWVGHAPTVSIQPINPEQERYKKLWARDDYRKVSPGEQLALTFLTQAKPKRDAEVIDFGCGTGRGGLMLALLGGIKVTLLDFADNCLDEEVAEACKTQADRIRFQVQDLTKPIPVHAAYGFCCDVMEHIPEADVPKVLANILSSAQHVFLNIATGPDHFGQVLDGHPLHLTQQPLSWWLDRLRELDAVVHWSESGPGHCSIYCTAWMDGKEVVSRGELNTSQDDAKANVRANLKAGWEQVVPHIANDFEVMILGGGPSLNEFEADIRQKRADGVKLVCLNGTYNWCLERGIKPSAVVVVDARPFNARFTHPVVDDCKYLIASQCHPDVLEGLPKDRTYLWHTTAEMFDEELREHYGDTPWWGIPGGSTVLLRAIPLLRMLGYRKFHLYGCDSCVIGDSHHGYTQSENDHSPIVPVTVSDGRVFQASAWMIAQAQDFMELVRFLGDEIEIATYGDGLLNHILATGAKLAGEET